MLRSYKFTEKPFLEYKMQNDTLHFKEIELTKKFVSSHPTIKDLDRSCPICGGKSIYFFSKWGVDYLRCNSCKSVFAVCDNEIVNEYLNYQELCDFRLSEEYQNSISLNREQIWQDFIEWLEVRTFRFLKRNRDLEIIDFGNRLSGYVEIFQKAIITGKYDLRDSILTESTHFIGEGEADIALYLDQLRNELKPKERLTQMRACLKDDGLLILNARSGIGFDITTLRENNEELCPYEHVMLPSVKGLTWMLQECGYEVLEVTTPGIMDVKYVMNSKNLLNEKDFFVRDLLEEVDSSILQEFQRFLQKSCLSSFVCIIARKGIQFEEV